ncbi:sigma-70 family RNA polymerase sigma factor [uncultured Roseobacter sp.]|uniref:sigma-70 family RNA polymerase sigma factor n=1 Tax=uncultured Roseobacter sp. TaxID=114847 RepID=UPI002632BE5C|nr:sigma-70 family RNA polymerase sigma factor [uncultured Roseobacter sp.]
MKNTIATDGQVQALSETQIGEDLSDLICRVALRDRVAFDALYQLTSRKLFGVALRMLKDPGEAEDAIQDIYVRIWQKADHFRPGQAQPMSWLIAIARNLSIDRLRRRKPPAVPITDASDVADPAPGPEAMTAQSMQRQQLDRCLDKLSPRKAEAVTSAYVEGYSYQELADRFQMPLNTVRTWLRRSLLSLRECLKENSL